MPLASYDDLIAAIQDWMLDRPDLAPRCADFIALAENDLNLQLRTCDQLTKTALALDANGQADIPSDYLAFRQVVAQSNPFCALDLVTPSFANRYKSGSGVPQYFTIDAGKLSVFPRSQTEVELTYFAKIPALSIDAPQNWLLQKFPNVYLTGACMYAGMFIGDAERTVGMTAMFRSQIETFQMAEEAGMYSRASMRQSEPTP